MTGEETPLSAAFLAQAGPTARAVEGDDLESTLRKIVEQAKSAWPTIAVAAAAFVRYLADRMPAGSDVMSKLRNLRTNDLYLACGCVHGDAAALAAFDETFMPQVPSYLARGNAPADFIEDVKQELRSSLLVARGRPERRSGIASYSGRGPLGAWVRVAALRAALHLDKERTGPPVAYRFEAEVTAPSITDPELAYVKRQYGAVLNQAVGKTLGALAPRDAALIALFFLQGATYEAIAGMYQISYGQARRWIAAVREKIVDETRRCLVEEMNLPSSHLDSLIRLMSSELDTSIVTVLKRP